MLLFRSAIFDRANPTSYLSRLFDSAESQVLRLLSVLLVFAIGCKSAETTTAPVDHAGMSERQAEVADRGAMVMPFDLERTTHVFSKESYGGLQKVVSDDGDKKQVALIREHLSHEAERFAKGDFHDPSMIHGEHMAGLHQLVMGHDKMTVEYSEIPEGAQIIYRTDDPSMVEAIHQWFDAQVSDHGRHAVGKQEGMKEGMKE